MGRKLHSGFLAYDRGLEDELRSSRICSVVTAAVIGAGATVYSASKSASASEKATKVAQSSADAQTEIARRQQDIAEEQYGRYKDVFQPIENQFIEESKGLGSMANQELAAGRAASTVEGTLGGAKKRYEENLASLGVNPNDARYGNTMAKMAMDGAAVSAAAQTGARETQVTKGRAAMTDIVNLGKGMPLNASSGLSTAASGLSAAGQLMANAGQGEARAWGSAAQGLGGITGSVLNSKSFQDWWSQPSPGLGVGTNSSGETYFPAISSGGAR